MRTSTEVHLTTNKSYLPQFYPFFMMSSCVFRAGIALLLFFIFPSLVVAQTKSLGTAPSEADRLLLDQLVARFYEKQRLLTEKQLTLATIQPQLSRMETLKEIAALAVGPRTTISKIKQVFPDEFPTMATEVAYTLSIKRSPPSPDMMRAALRQTGFTVNDVEAAIRNHPNLPERLASQKQLEEIEIRQLMQSIGEVRAQVSMVAPKVGLKAEVLLGSGN